MPLCRTALHVQEGDPQRLHALRTPHVGARGAGSRVIAGSPRPGHDRSRGEELAAAESGIACRPPSDGEGASVVAQRAGAPPPSGLLVSGIIPPLADPYFQRQETGVDLRSGLFPGQTAVLTHGAQTETAPAEQGGTGKTQLAAEFMHALRGVRAVDVLIWISAVNRESVVAGFARAAETVGAGNPEPGAEAAATALLSWLARTDRPWALVIDDLADLSDLRGLWPSGPAGQVVITTRLPAAAFSSWAAAGP